jgi:hypothetical protein
VFCHLLLLVQTWLEQIPLKTLLLWMQRKMREMLETMEQQLMREIGIQ